MPNPPSPGLPIALLCRRDLRDTVGGIGTLAGYLTDVTVNANEPEGVPSKVYSCVVVDAGIDEQTERFPQGHDVQTWNWMLSVDVSKPASVTDFETDELAVLVYSDIKRAVLADRTRGTYAFDTKVFGYTPREDGTGIEVRGMCEVETLNNAPNEL